jgi:hypothetical protein
VDTLNANFATIRLSPLIILAIVSFVGCQANIPELNELEIRSASTIQKSLGLYEALNPNSQITNLPQIFAATMDFDRWHRRHPALLQHEFRRFGDKAGFTNSFYEKYILVPPGFTNRAVHGKAIFMNALPYPDYEGKLIRIVIWRAAAEDYRISWVPEPEIQQVFRTAGVAIPRAGPMPQPPAPPGNPALQRSARLRVVSFIENLAYHYDRGKALWFSLVIVVMLLVIGLLFIFLRSSSRPRPSRTRE